MFKALLIDKTKSGTSTTLRNLALGDLPENDTRVKIEYSTLNYKDALAITGKGKIIRRYPLVPGIDFAGTIEKTTHPNLRVGDAVILNGYGFGESKWGGLAEYASVKGDCLIRTPKGMSAKKAMAAGTAGYTAALCVNELDNGHTAKAGLPVVVTGATGGVGGYAIALLKNLGYSVTAVTGKASASDYLKSIGAETILPRDEFVKTAKPLETPRWCGAVDTLGGLALSRILSETDRHGTVAICGLALDHTLKTTVMPFILRGVRLIGIDSVYMDTPAREKAWKRLSALDDTAFNPAITEIALDDVPSACEQIIDGTVVGRYIVKMSAH